MESVEQTIIGEADTSRAATVRRRINKLIKESNASTFDLMDLLHESKAKNYIAGWGFDSFSKFAKSLDIKYTKCFYLVAIKENMAAAGLERAAYEPVGMTKLRMISRLDPEVEYNGTPVSLLIRELTLKAKEMEPDEVQLEVDTILGLTEEESMVWLNTRVKKLAKDNVILPALRKAKRYMGQQKDEEGEFHDASDGAGLEMVCANFLADPNFDTPDDETVTEETVTTPDKQAEDDADNTVAPDTENAGVPEAEAEGTDKQYSID
jgi:hypothetical protein